MFRSCPIWQLTAWRAADTQFTGILPTASSVGVNGMASDLSLIGSLTGGAVETRHVLVVEPISSAVASGLAWVV